MNLFENFTPSTIMGLEWFFDILYPGIANLGLYIDLVSYDIDLENHGGLVCLPLVVDLVCCF